MMMAATSGWEKQDSNSNMYINSNHKSQCQPCCSTNQSGDNEEPLYDHITQALMYSRKFFPSYSWRVEGYEGPSWSSYNLINGIWASSCYDMILDSYLLYFTKCTKKAPNLNLKNTHTKALKGETETNKSIRTLLRTKNITKGFQKKKTVTKKHSSIWVCSVN